VTSPWTTPDEHPHLGAGVVHVWCLLLDPPAHQLEGFHASLSADERERAARYHFERHRRRFVACRGQVRQILGQYRDEPAAALRFRYGPRGKPALDMPGCDSAIEFNVSNSEDVALLAVARGRELGVDVERVREPRDFDALARQFFAQNEVKQLHALPVDCRLEAFFNGWTRKEAVLKAVGTGLAFPLDKVVVTLAPDEPARVVAYDGDSPSDWWLASLGPMPGYVGAVAARGRPLEVQCWRSIWHSAH
jgi:4'-phosphopantetheinyl transferase